MNIYGELQLPYGGAAFIEANRILSESWIIKIKIYCPNQFWEGSFKLLPFKVCSINLNIRLR